MNGNQLDSILRVSNIICVIGTAVYREVSKIEGQKQVVDDLISISKIHKHEGEIDILRLGKLYDTYNLGDGETESIAICLMENYSICCDDRKARLAAEIELTAIKVMGSLKILKMTVDEDIIKCTDAQICYLEMKFKGGFLPKNIDTNYFCKSS